MKIVITGGAGFLGQLLLRALCERGTLTDASGEVRRIAQIVAVDQSHSGRLFVDDRVEYVVGDVAAAGFINHVMETNTDTVFHLAAVVSGAAEADFDLGMHVNVDGMRTILNACRAQHAIPKLVFASSVAVFGGDLPDILTDDTQPTPQTSYGIQKLIGELLLSDCTRKGFIDGRAVRLPTIVVRPGKPNAAASSFASGIVREPLAGEISACPVGAETAMWVLSPAAAIAAFVRAHEIPSDVWGARRALNLPGLTVTVAQMLEALRAVGGDAAVARVQMQPDERIRAIVRTWPARFETARADTLGFARDADVASIVRAYAREHAPAPR